MTLSVPTIDISRLPGDREAIDAIARACEEWGFFQVVGHGIDPAMQDHFIAETKRFFHQSTEVKRQTLRDETNPMGFYDQELTKNTRDWKEVFDYGIDRRDPGANLPSRWPVGLAGFADVMNAWYDACEEVSFTLLVALADAMGVNAAVLTSCFAPVNTSFVRLNYYPVCHDPAPGDSPSVIAAGSLGVNRHTDAGALTVLVQDNVPALQVNRDERWYTITPEPGGLIINAGDMLQVWSNDRFRAAEHRVIASSNRERFSAPYFFNPSFDTNCVPLGADDEDALYHPINWGHFRTQRAHGDYGDFGEEIQISQFRKSA